MTWHDYVLFTSTTALPVASDPEYLRLGVLEEAHEALAAYHAWQAAVRGREKRALRGDDPAVLRAKDIAASRACAQLIEELGDLAWYCARLEVVAGRGIKKRPSVATPCVEIARCIGWIEDSNSPQIIYASALQLIQSFQSMILVPLETILDANVAKLTTRKSAGTIQGEGHDD